MTTQTCFLCSAELIGDASSREHIIPNALGGRLKSRSLLCVKCNSYCSRIDGALVKQLLPLANVLDVVRERGVTPSVRVKLESGVQMQRDPDGHMRPVALRPTVVERDSVASFSITAGSRIAVRKHLDGLKRKYPKLDIDGVMATISETTTRANERTEFTFPPLGGAEAFRAIVKIAVSYYLHVGGRVAVIRDAIDVVAHEGLPALARVGCLYAVDPLPDRDDDKVVHVLAVASDEDGGLHAYVELFSAFRFTVRLADAYAGHPMCVAYGYDVCTRAEVEIDAANLRGLPWTPEDWDPDAVDRALEPVIAVAVTRNQTAWSP